MLHLQQLDFVLGGWGPRQQLRHGLHEPGRGKANQEEHPVLGSGFLYRTCSNGAAMVVGGQAVQLLQSPECQATSKAQTLTSSTLQLKSKNMNPILGVESVNFKIL